MAADPSYDGELAGSILLEDGESYHDDPGRPLYSGLGGSQSPAGVGMPFFGLDHDARSDLSQSPGSGSSRGARGLAAQRGSGENSRTPCRTPSPVYTWNNPKKVSICSDGDGDLSDALAFRATLSEEHQAAPSAASTGDGPSAAAAAASGGAGGEASAFGQMPFPPLFNPYWAGNFNAQAYYGMMLQNPALMNPQAVAAAAAASGASLPPGGLQPGALPPAAAAAAAAASAAGGSTPGLIGPGSAPGGGGAQSESKPTGPQGPPMEYIQMMLAMQAMQAQGSAAAAVGKGASQSTPSSNSTAAPMAAGIPAADDRAPPDYAREPGFRGGLPAADERTSLETLGPRGGLGGAAALAAPVPVAEGKRKARGGGKDANATAMRAPPPEAAVPKERGGKGDRRRRGGAAGAVGEEIEPQPQLQQQRPGGKSKTDSRPASSPIIEQLKSRERNIELNDLTNHITEIAQDQYGSRLIQQKLEVATDEEKQRAFKAILQKMPQLTIDVFGNYVIQKFFEYGNAEQRRILAEQLVGQVLKLSHQMYGCRVVQKALDSVPIEQQVLLIGELKGHVITCIEDQHGNHVIQKCIERLPTDKINFIVDSFDGQSTRMAKHCYGCRVIQRLIEYCSSSQISTLLDEVLRNLMDLATDQYGNYVVQHVFEHSSRPGDRQNVLFIVRKNINLLSCHKYASNVVEKALSCGTSEEKAALISGIVGDPGDTHPPLINMMRDRFGNYIVQKTIGLAQSPQREALLWKLHEQMPTLKKSNTYGKHIISALERAQAQGPPP